MWALSVPRTMFSGKVKVIVSEAEVPANGKSISIATGRRESAEPQASAGDGVKKAGITSSVLKSALKREGDTKIRPPTDVWLCHVAALCCQELVLLSKAEWLCLSIKVPKSPTCPSPCPSRCSWICSQTTLLLFGLHGSHTRTAPVLSWSLSLWYLHLPLGHRSEVWVFSSSSPSAWWGKG